MKSKRDLEYVDEEELLWNKNISHRLISPGYLENIFPNLIFQNIKITQRNDALFLFLLILLILKVISKI